MIVKWLATAKSVAAAHPSTAQLRLAQVLGLVVQCMSYPFEMPTNFQIDPGDDWVPLRRPHFDLRDGHLYFLLSSRPHAKLDSGDAVLWEKIDGVATIGELERTQPEARNRLQRLWSLETCEFAPSSFPSRRKRVLVVEPHMDDAILSVGGLMWSLRESCEFTLATVGGQSNFTSYYELEREFFDVARVSELRSAESALVMRLLGGHHLDLALPEAPQRYRHGNWTLEWFKQHHKAIGGFIGHSASAQEVEAWATAIARVLLTTEADEVWMPLGIGSHVDHELTRNACLQVVSRTPSLLDRCRVFLYQDVPYANLVPQHTSQIVDAISKAGGSLELQLSDITESFEAKLRLLSIFGSQFKMSFMTPRVVRAARATNSDGSSRFECRYRLSKIPGEVNALDVYSGKEAVETLVQRLRRWYRSHRLTRRLRLLCPVPLGRWADDTSALLRAFPNATLEIYVSENNIAETEVLTSPRIDVRTVSGSGIAWLWQVGRLAVSMPYPIVLVPGVSRVTAGVVVKILCPFADAITAPRISHFIQAIEMVSRGDSSNVH